MLDIITPADSAYFNIIDTINKYGDNHKDRTGVGTKRVFGAMFKFDLMESFPIITCKKAAFKNTLAELLWFIQPEGCDNINNLKSSARKWWSPFCVNDKGWIGPMYNKQLTNYEGEKQITKVDKKTELPPSLHGLDFINEDIIPTEEIDKKLLKTWRHIIDRCYKPSCKEYVYYGGKSVFLSQEWHTLSNFLKDVKRLPNWYHKYNSYTEGKFTAWQLDKDYYGSNCYSKDTCVWLSISDNNLYRDARLFKRSDGTLYISKTKAALDLDVSGATQISRVLNNKRPHCKNYDFEYIDTKDLYRYSLPVNQIERLIEGIKKDPYSRRHMLTTYNPVDAPIGGLYTCHGNISQFMIDSNNRLHLSTTQRSMDVGLGCPHNWISYSLLLIMVCLCTGYVPGTLTYFVNDLHIYNNHLDALTKMKRVSYSQPQLEVNDTELTDKSIFDFKMDDFNLLNYKSGPSIKLEMAI